jgi:hypothetical protein
MTQNKSKTIMEDYKIGLDMDNNMTDDGIFLFNDIKHCPAVKLKVNQIDVKFKTENDLMIDD